MSRTPDKGRRLGLNAEARRYGHPKLPQHQVAPRIVADFSTLPELVKHARSDLGATHVAGNGAETRIYFPRGDGQYEEATVWQKGNYWHATGPGARQVVRSLPRGAQPLTSQTMRRASEARRRDAGATPRSFAGYDFTTGPQGTTVHRQHIDTHAPGDYGADPLGDGTFRMVPSGDIVDYAERNRRLKREGAVKERRSAHHAPDQRPSRRTR